MRKLALIVSAALAACACLAEPFNQAISLALGDATAGTQTVENVRGYLNAIHVSVSDGASTGTVQIAIVPSDTNVSAINVATNSVVATDTWRPRVDATDVAGSALTSDPPLRYPLTGDDLRMIVSGSPTGVTWRATIKVDR
jgi:hypothetical protein